MELELLNRAVVEGCSTGGWVSLALQLFYPDFFNGCFSYSPDQVDFENCQLINIYKDENAFYNEFDYLRPLMRETSGEPVISQKDFVQFENVLGRFGHVCYIRRPVQRFYSIIQSKR